MKIKCPNCSTAYRVNLGPISEKGKHVKCSSCNHRFIINADDYQESEPLSPGTDPSSDDNLAMYNSNNRAGLDDSSELSIEVRASAFEISAGVEDEPDLEDTFEQTVIETTHWEEPDVADVNHAESTSNLWLQAALAIILAVILLLAALGGVYLYKL